MKARLRCLSIMSLCFPVFCASIHAADERSERDVQMPNGITLHVLERGTGESVIFIHGSASDFSMWEDEVAQFAGDGYHAVAYSRRYNSPNSNASQPNHSASVEANDLDLLLVQLGISRAHIIGHSYGAYTALLFALKNPKAVITLTLAEPPLVPWLTKIEGENSEAAKALYAKILNDMVAPTRRAFKAGKDEQGLTLFLDFVAGKGAIKWLPKTVTDRCRQNLQELKALFISNDIYPKIDPKSVASLRIPTLILSGANSDDVGQYTDDELERLIPPNIGMRVRVDDATHLMWTEKPDQCRASVYRLIRGRKN
jgi:pimeloyl-ACP methyl ester carboxylesterase